MQLQQLLPLIKVNTVDIYLTNLFGHNRGSAGKGSCPLLVCVGDDWAEHVGQVKRAINLESFHTHKRS